MTIMTAADVDTFTQAVLTRFPSWTVKHLFEDLVTGFAPEQAAGIQFFQGSYYIIGQIDGEIRTVDHSYTLEEALDLVPL